MKINNSAMILVLGTLFCAQALADSENVVTGGYAHTKTAGNSFNGVNFGNDSNLLIVFYVQIMPDDFVMQLHRF